MKSLPSDRSNFDHRKGVKYSLLKNYIPEVPIYTPKCTHVPIFI